MNAPVAWELRVWLMKFLAGRHTVVLNATVRDGGFVVPHGKTAVFWRTEVHGAQRAAVTVGDV